VGRIATPENNLRGITPRSRESKKLFALRSPTQRLVYYPPIGSRDDGSLAARQRRSLLFRTFQRGTISLLSSHRDDARRMRDSIGCAPSHLIDKDKRYTHGEFETLEAAVEAAKKIIDDGLLNDYEPGMSASTLYSRYKMFGEDPWVSGPGDSHFSAWKYAEARCEIICAGTGPTPSTRIMDRLAGRVSDFV